MAHLKKDSEKSWHKINQNIYKKIYNFESTVFKRKRNSKSVCFGYYATNRL